MVECTDYNKNRKKLVEVVNKINAVANPDGKEETTCKWKSCSKLKASAEESPAHRARQSESWLKESGRVCKHSGHCSENTKKTSKE